MMLTELLLLLLHQLALVSWPLPPPQPRLPPFSPLVHCVPITPAFFLTLKQAVRVFAFAALLTWNSSPRYLQSYLYLIVQALAQILHPRKFFSDHPNYSCCFHPSQSYPVLLFSFIPLGFDHD